MTDPKLERLLGDALQQRGRALTQAPLDLADVRREARRIRRRRVSVTAAVAAAVVVVAVPVGLLVRPGPPPDAPDPAVTSSVVPSPPAETEPGIAYYADHVIHQTDGNTIDVPDDLDVRDFALLSDGRVVLVVDDGGTRKVVVLADGRPTTYGLAGGGIVVGDASKIIGWVGSDGKGRTLLSGETAPLAWPLPGDPKASAAALRGSDCWASAEHACSMITTMPRAGGGTVNREFSSYLPTVDSITEQRDRPFNAHLGTIQGIAPDDSAVTGSLGPTSTCSGLWDLQQKKMRWQTCDYSRLRFSPDARLVTAFPGKPSPDRPSGLALLDAATGKQVAVVHPGTIMDLAWESTATVLLSVADGDDTRLMRLSTDGTLTPVGPTRSGRWAYLLPADEARS